MQIWTPVEQPRDDGEFSVRLNPGSAKPFAIITLSEDGNTELVMQSVADCDRLARGAALAKSLLLGETSGPARKALDPERDDWDGEELASQRAQDDEQHDTGTDAS